MTTHSDTPTADSSDSNDHSTDERADDTTHTADDLSIEIPETARPDEVIPVRITGAAPATTVTLEATMADLGGCHWRSEAAFEATEQGTVDLTEHAPTDGSYEGVAPMGWLWSMDADEQDRQISSVTSGLVHTETTTVTVEASTENQTATAQIERGFETEDIQQTEVTSEAFVGTIFEPSDEGPHPGVLVLHGSGGKTPVMEAALLASHGFSALALNYIGDAEELPDQISEIPVTYFDTAADWLSERDGVTDEPLGIVGRSRGAEIGLWLGAHRDWAGAVISYVGSTVLWDTPAGTPAWVDEDGQALPYVTGQGKPTLCVGQLDDADEETRDAATIPVENIDGPVLFISGGEDPLWPARRLAERGMDRLDDADFEYEYDHLTHEDAGHFITPPYLPKSHHVFGGTPAGMAHMDATSWPVVLDYLSR
jgi:dienelactone hydrolase